MPPNDTRAWSVRQLAAYWGVSPKKVREMIRRGILQAFDVGVGRPQLRITNDAVREAERRLAVRNPAPSRRRRDDDIDPRILKLLDAD